MNRRKRNPDASGLDFHQRLYGAVKRSQGSQTGNWCAAPRQDPYPGVMTELEYYRYCKKHPEVAAFWRELAEVFETKLTYEMVK